ncbi:ABC transporter I family member 11 [Carex littledalei]|uniref:ABC transporter I family member 11 n=1 Tax=Carex littledalei TaxID=544730 RepID=A0A833RS73_9POAL|nr:ABC transporter I family member 11 [Carex littledalei]
MYQCRFGLIFGRSGSGKTTLLQILAGLVQPTCGSVSIQKYGIDSSPIVPPKSLLPERVVLFSNFLRVSPKPQLNFFFCTETQVHLIRFVHITVLEEITFGWPRQKSDALLREELALNLQYAITSVGLKTISLDEDPHCLSGGFKRRLALAVQLPPKTLYPLLIPPTTYLTPTTPLCPQLNTSRNG